MDSTGTIRSLAPGLLAAIAIAAVAQPIASAAGSVALAAQGLLATGASPISPIPVAVVIGLIAANTLGVPARLGPGLDAAVKHLLKVGIVLVGLKLSFVDVLRVGIVGIPVIFTIVAFALGISLFLAERAGVGRRVGALTAASTAICGITATLAVAPAIGADDREVAYTVANVTLFGLFGMLVYPYLAHALFADQPAAAGLFLGTAIHDTSQVMGAALTYGQVFGDPVAMEVATVTKLTRNAMLVGVVPLLGWLSGRDRGTTSLRSLFPMFVLWFVVASAIRTAGDIALGATGAWHDAVSLLGGPVSTFALATALAAVGLKTRLSVLATLGPRPFLLGLGAAAAVTGASLALAALVGPLLG